MTKATGSRIVADTREQKPYQFTNSTRTALTSGDYSLLNLEDQISIERKELSDFYNCVGSDRDRFTRELERLSEFDLPIVVIEADLAEILKPNKHGSQLHPNSILGSIGSWIAKYGIIFIFAGGRELAKRMTEKILNKYMKYQQDD